MCVTLLLVFAALLSLQQPETLSLLGEPLHAPKLPKAARAAADAELQRAHAAYIAKPSGVAEILALHRAHLALGRVGDSLVVLTHGVEANPDAPELHLERGRGYILIRKFAVAQRDLAKATEKLPDARCALGLAEYLAGDFARARATITGCPEPGVFGYLAERRGGGSPGQPPIAVGRTPPSSPALRFPGALAKEDAAASQPIATRYLEAIERLLDRATEEGRAKAEDEARARLKQILE